MLFYNMVMQDGTPIEYFVLRKVELGTIQKIEDYLGKLFYVWELLLDCGHITVHVILSKKSIRPRWIICHKCLMISFDTELELSLYD